MCQGCYIVHWKIKSRYLFMCILFENFKLVLMLLLSVNNVFN